MIDRRRFLLTSLASALAVPVAAGAQQAGKVYRVGYLFESQPPDPTPGPLRAFENALRDMGYVEGRNLVVERRFAGFKWDRLPALAAELVRLKPDVILTGGSPSIGALKQATTTIPHCYGVVHRPGRSRVRY
jgi:putative ABC transport system substrate-binding protein